MSSAPKYRPPSKIAAEKSTTSPTHAASTSAAATADAPAAVSSPASAPATTATTAAAAAAPSPPTVTTSTTPLTPADSTKRFTAKTVKVIPINQMWALRDAYLDAPEGFNFEAKLRASRAADSSTSSMATPLSSATAAFPDVLIMSSAGYKRRDVSGMEASEKHLRNLQSALNKLTGDNFQSLVPPLLIPALFDDNIVHQVVERIYDKSLDEPLYNVQYAQMCHDFAKYQFDHLGEGKTFRVALVSKAQEMFEAPYNRRADGTFDKAGSEDDVAEKIRKRKINNIRFTGQLHLNRLVNDKVIAFIVSELVFSEARASPELDVEVVCMLLETVGEKLDQKVKAQIDTAYAKLKAMQESLSNRIRFMVQNLLELREKNWARPQVKSAEEMVAEAKRVCGIVDVKDSTQWWPQAIPSMSDKWKKSILTVFTSEPASFFAKVALLEGSHPAPVNRMCAVAEMTRSLCLKSDDVARGVLVELLKKHEHAQETAHALGWVLVQSVLDDLSSDCPNFNKRLAAVVIGAAPTGGAPQIGMLRDVISRSVAAIDGRREAGNGDAVEGADEGILLFWPVAMRTLVEMTSNLTHGAVLSALAAIPSGPCWSTVLPDVLSGLTTSGCCTVPQLSTWRDNHVGEAKYSTIIEGLSELLAV